jgi:O-methyltransferase involved in polyketide biosynthesis
VPVADAQRVRLAAIGETLFIPLTARAQETAKKRPLLRDPKAVEMVASIDFDGTKYGKLTGRSAIVPRTAVLDFWVRTFLADSPAGTVVDVGTGLNTRFERLDNGTVHWVDMDLPETVELRRHFFTDTDRRRMVASTVTDQAWLSAARETPGPYFFVIEGLLCYLEDDEAEQVLTRIADQFPGAFIAMDSYPRRTIAWLRRMTAKRGVTALVRWGVDDPRSLERLGLRVVESATLTRPPRALLAQWPIENRIILPALDPIASRVLPLFGKTFDMTLFRATPK